VRTYVTAGKTGVTIGKMSGTGVRIAGTIGQGPEKGMSTGRIHPDPRGGLVPAIKAFIKAILRDPKAGLEKGIL